MALYLNQIIGTKAQRKADYYARKEASREIRRMRRAIENRNAAYDARIEAYNAQHAIIEQAHSEGAKPAKASVYRGVVSVRGGESGQGKKIATGNVSDPSIVMDICKSVIEQGYYITNADGWMWAIRIQEAKTR